MASTTLSTGLRKLGVKPGVLFSKTVPSTPSKICVAYITSRSSQLEPLPKPKPWPYEKYGYSNMTAIFLDRTWKRLHDNSKVIVVEGMPAIGKSNVARALAEEFEMKYFPMVTADSWYVNRYGHDARQIDPKLPPHLRSFSESDFFKNPKHEKTVVLQFMLWYQKFVQYMDALSHLLNTGQGVVLDRCVYSEPVFTDAFFKMGFISNSGKKALQRLKEESDPYEEFMRPHLVVYLDAPVSVVEQNLKKRGRGEEKVFTRELLETIEHNYKFDYLKRITEHAELLAYDWSTPGDAEVIVEDIERIDFDRFDLHDPKMQDWRLREDSDWDLKRWHFTNNVTQTLNGILLTPVFGCPQMLIPADEVDMYEAAWESVPGNKYADSYNADVGDQNILFKSRCEANVWRDFDLDPIKK